MDQMRGEMFRYVQSDDLQSLKQLLDAEESRRKDLLGEKDEAGRNVLLFASMLGRSVMVRELVTCGAQVDERTVRGYTALHLAAGWGHMETVRTLLELGADAETKTFRGERPVDLARKYSKTDCADCLMQASEDALRNLDNHTSEDVESQPCISQSLCQD